MHTQFTGMIVAEPLLGPGE